MPTTARARAVAALALSALLLTGACSGGGSATAKATPAPAGSTPKPSLMVAVSALLTAEQHGDHAASYALLDADGRAAYTDVGKWERRRTQLPAVTGFEVKAGPKDGTVVATVDHKPGLDPFTGLSPAHERQTWTGRQAGAGWLVDPDPRSDPVLPADDTAPPVAKAWAEAVQACDKTKAKTLEAVDTVFGTSSEAAKLCGATGPVTVSANTERLASGPASQDIVAQYTTDALVWARVVRVTAPRPFLVVVAPIDTAWRVIGISD